MKNSVKSFDDLNFKKHKVCKGVQAFHEFPNGNTISVVGGEGMYGDGVVTFEVMTNLDSLNGEGGVIGWQSRDEVTDIINSLQYKGGISPKAAKDLLEQAIDNLLTLEELGESYAHFQSAKYTHTQIKKAIKNLR